MTTWKQILLAFAVGVLAGVIALGFWSDKQVGRLKVVADSLTRVDSALHAAAATVVTTTQQKNAEIDRHTAPANAAEPSDSAAEADADRALAAAQTARDSIAALLTAKRAADSTIADLRIQRDDAIRKFNNEVQAVDSLNYIVASMFANETKLNTQIQALRAPPSFGKKLLYVGAESVLLGAAYKIGEVVGRTQH